MGTRNFNKWLSNFRDSISTYGYYADFDKIHKNVAAIKVELNILNSLIGSKDIEKEFKSLLTRYPQVLKCLPILLAVRADEVCTHDEKGECVWSFATEKIDSADYCRFMRKSGLFDLISKHLVNNLVDYVTGVETGLDSNGRKNRGGHLMEDLVEDYIKNLKIKYYKEMRLSEIRKAWGINLSAISNRGKSEKRFDFVIKTPSTVYAIEANFYTSGGSKLNETARSYKNIAVESKQIKGFEFVWFTDGKGWHSARNNLEEAFEAIEHLYNIHDLEQGVMRKLFI